MKIAALIVAAGRSSRMGNFKPMLQLGSITIAERVVTNFRQAGIQKIVMVTGYQAAELERHLANRNLIFLRNEKYAETQMFDSVRIGLEYLKDKADRILFCPVDVPLFTAETVHRLLETDAPLVTPICDGVIGHPIVIRSDLVDKILAHSGERGLKGAMEASGAEHVYLEVSDEGIRHDADTPDDYEELLQLHNASLIRSSIQISLSKEKPFFDEQCYTLLSLIRETGSVREAGARMHISYSTCWNMIRTLESQLKNPLLLRTQGGSKGSHSELTVYGTDLIDRYERYSRDLRRYADETFQTYFSDIFKN
ncbi:MAG: NTP transferase domain-containing protein [Eubacteriales bacterium]|nr:NTP transferase domain-containing protein [Eubacteriales bacterium]